MSKDVQILLHNLLNYVPCHTDPAHYFIISNLLLPSYVQNSSELIALMPLLFHIVLNPATASDAFCIHPWISMLRCPVSQYFPNTRTFLVLKFIRLPSTSCPLFSRDRWWKLRTTNWISLLCWELDTNANIMSDFLQRRSSSLLHFLLTYWVSVVLFTKLINVDGRSVIHLIVWPSVSVCYHDWQYVYTILHNVPLLLTSRHHFDLTIGNHGKKDMSWRDN